MTDFRALCAELHAAFNTYAVDESHHGLLVRVDAALAQPEPEPEVDDILRLAAIIREVNGGKKLGAAALAEAILSHRDSCWGRSAQSEPQGSGPTNQELVNVWEDCKHAEPDPSFPKPLIFAHAVLARWGRPAKPKLQGPELTDEELTDQEIEKWADAASEVPPEEMDPEVHGWRRCFKSEEFCETIRAAITCWGRPAVEPVSERFEFSVLDCEHEERAGGTTPTYSQALSEGQHYLAMYSQDSPHTLELRRVEVLPHWALPAPQQEAGQ